MKNKFLFLLCMLVCISAQAQDSSIAQDSPAIQAPPADIVQNFIDAYNAHDVERMQSFVTDDLRWMSIDKDKVNVETAGKKEQSESMTSYFEGLPSTRSTLHSVSSLGNFVTAIEESGWESKGETKSQCAISVYELIDGLISNVWYFAARPCESATTE